MDLIQTSNNPVQDLETVAYKGQPKHNRQYRPGYENYLRSMPKLDRQDDMNDTYVKVSSAIMSDLADKLAKEDWVLENNLGSNEFSRTIIAMENPHTENGIKEGVELLVAKWGKGFESPVHGHANGMLHEDLLYGDILVNTYKVVSPNMVRPYKTEIFTGRTRIVSEFNWEDSINHPRPNLVHNFRAISNSASLHYVAEHTRDGRDNGFNVEYFDQAYDIRGKVRQITSREAHSSKPGDVLLIRSTNVPFYKDHFVVITGGLIEKPHGIRPQDHAVPASDKSILNEYEAQMGLTILKLNDEACKAFMNFHKIKI